MSDVFISYARSTGVQAKAVAEALRRLGYGVWLDDELPAHRAYTQVIEERLKAAKAVVVIWSAEAAKSEWVQSEADRAREDRKLVQLTVDGAKLPMPFDRIQCADLAGWTGEADAPGWRKVVASVAELVGGGDIAALPTVSPPLPLPTKPSIAVLPFANLSGDPEQDYFADGMVDEITTALSRFKSIFVIASGSSLSFKGKGINPQEVARQMGVRYVLEGSVRKAGGRVRIAVKLTEATDGSQIWADRFEDTLEDVFALQDRVALSVAGKIEPTVERAEIRRASARPTDNLGSYDLYLRALPLMRSLEGSDAVAALDLLNRAIALDPDYGIALATAAFCHSTLVILGDDSEHHHRQAIELSQRALKAADNDSDTLALAGATLLQLGEDSNSFVSLAERSIAINPGASSSWFVSGWGHLVAGETDLAIERIETSMRLDPFSPIRFVQLTGLGAACFEQGRWADAVALLKESAQLRSAYPTNHALLGASYGHLGQPGAAREAFARYRNLSDAPIDELPRWMFRNPDHRKLYIDGIALAERETPFETACEG